MMSNERLYIFVALMFASTYIPESETGNARMQASGSFEKNTPPRGLVSDAI